MPTDYSSFFQSNQELWDLYTEVNSRSGFYDMASFLEGRNSLTPIEMEDLGGEIAGKTLLHLQCHFGQDSLSWARLGAEVTAIDLSEKAVMLARQLNEQLGLNAHFLQSNVYDLPSVLEEQFDIVFTSFGVLGWLPDMQAWAAIVARYLKPGGIFYIAEFHPTLYMFDFDNLQIAYDYFNRGTPYEEVATSSYADDAVPMQQKHYFWQHSLSEILQALIGEGLQLLEFREFPHSPYNCFANMEPAEPGFYKLKEFSSTIPHVFSLKMRKTNFSSSPVG